MEQGNEPVDRVLLDIKMPTPAPFRLDPNTTAVVIVDMQKLFLNRERPPFRRNGCIPGNRRLLDKARKAGAEVIFIQSVRRPDAREFVRFGCPPKLLLGSEDAEIIDDLAPLPDETVVQKFSHDPFARTELENVLTKKGIVNENWTVLVTGVSAAVCAHACALGFSNRDYMTLIPLDCTAAGTVEEEARVYAQYQSHGYAFNIDFTSSDLVTFETGAPAAESQRPPRPPTSR